MTAPQHIARGTPCAALALALAACSPPTSSLADAADTRADVESAPDTNPLDAGPRDGDASPDAMTAPDASDAARDVLDAMSAPDAASTGLPCLGESLPLAVSHHLPFTTVSVGGGASPPSGLFLIDVATTASAIDLHAFGSTPPPSTGCDPSQLGQSCAFADLDFFGGWGRVVLTTEDLSGLGGGATEAGILGTDFTSALILTLDYDARVVRRATRASACSDAALIAAGFAPLPSVGYYASDPATLRPLTDVDSSASRGVSVPNVPTVTVRLAGVGAVAQLDTGFDDARVPMSVNVNVALFDAIQSARPGALVRDAARDLALSTCVVGVSESVEAYDLAPGSSLEFVAAGGTAARSFTGAAVFVKRTPPAARSCGGVGTWSAPAAQIAASLLASLGTAVFDPFSGRVWIPAR